MNDQLSTNQIRLKSVLFDYCFFIKSNRLRPTANNEKNKQKLDNISAGAARSTCASIFEFEFRIGCEKNPTQCAHAPRHMPR